MDTVCTSMTLDNFLSMASHSNVGFISDFSDPIFETRFSDYAASTAAREYAEKRSKWKKYINRKNRVASYCAGESYCIEVKSVEGSYRHGMAVVITKSTSTPNYY